MITPSTSARKGYYSLFFSVFSLFVSGLGWGQTTYSTPGSHNYTVPAGVECITVQIWGAGGAGGSNNTTSNGSGGGGGGGYTFAIVPVTPGQVINLFVGAGGQPVSGSNGEAGQNSWFVSSSDYFAGGGSGGAGGGVTTGGTGGTGTFSGGNGGNGRPHNTGNGGGGGSSAGTAANGSNGTDGGGSGPGAGGTAPAGGGNGSEGVGPNVTAAAGFAPGGGGGGSGDNNGSNSTGGAGGNGQIIVTTNSLQTCGNYCSPPAYTNSSDGYISNVNINGVLNNPSAWAGYTNFGSLGCASVQAGSTITITVTITRTSTFVMHHWFWIDWNLNGVFESSEAYDLGQDNTVGTFNYPITLTVPCDAATRNLRMRVRTQFSTDPTPCTTPTSWGETEDYCINVIPAVTPISSAGSDQTISCTSSATLNASGSFPASGYWSLVSGSGTIANPTSQTSTVTGLSNGDNVFRWHATGTCSVAVDDVVINVSGLPDIPVFAGDDIYTCQPVALSGSNPAPFTGQWVVTGFPGGAPAPQFTPDATDPNAVISNLISGTYTLSWQVDASPCPVISDQINLFFNSLPVPNAGLDQTICPTGTVLNGNDFSGAIGTWSVVSGPNTPGILDVNDPETQLYGMIPGAYVFRWTVSGGGCLGNPFDDVTVTVNNCTTPVAHAVNSNQAFTGCSYSYTDNGGPAGNYSPNVNMTMTEFCPDDPNAFATITFTSAAFNVGDYVVVYDSPNPGAPIVASYYYSTQGSGSTIGSPAVGTTITSSTGCLYVMHHTNGSSQAAGWVANVGCSPTAGVQSQQFVSPQNCGGGGGTTICSSGQQATSSNNATNPPDLGLANSGCLQGREGTSNQWIYITASSPGYIVFEIDPAGGQDFDYALWGPYSGLECPGATLDDPIRCSFAANGGAGCPSRIGLGFTNTVGNAVAPSDVSEGPTCSATNEGWTYPVYANTGDVYILLLQNFGTNSSSYGFSINTPGLLNGQPGAGLSCDPPPIPLPVELNTFNGIHENRVNQLFWTTLTERDNDFFTIERSNDGINWSVLAHVQGAGSTTETQHYATIDPNPFAGITYYRLSQTDYDGTTKALGVISLNSEIVIEDLFSDLYPNPTSESFTFNYGGKDFNTPIVMTLVNNIGQVIEVVEFTEFNKNQGMTVDVANLATGIYHVAIVQGEHRELKKISVVK